MEKQDVRALAAMPFYGSATELINKAELVYFRTVMAHDAEFRDRHNLGEHDTVRVCIADTNRLQWTVDEACEACEGDGYFYTASGREACECTECDGEGKQPGERKFITDFDGMPVDQETLQ